MNATQKNAVTYCEAFNFNASDKQLSPILLNGQIYFVAVEICEILELSNTTKALYALDDDEKLTLPLVRAGQKRTVNLINESGLYNLIFQSRKPEAKSFRKWVTSEVLPSIRKTGSYSVKQKAISTDFIDARDKVFGFIEFSGKKIRHIIIDEKDYYSVNDINKAIGANTGSNQVAKKLNAKKRLAEKIFVFGNTHPAWFTTGLGMQLIIQGSRVISNAKILV